MPFDQEPPPPTPTVTKKIPSVTEDVTIVFPQSNQKVVLNPTPLARGDNPWSYPYPNTTEQEATTKGFQHYLDTFGEKFCTDIFLDGLVSHCQIKWKAAVASEQNPVETFIKNFFRSRRELGVTSVKLRKASEEKAKELRKAKDAGKSKPELVLIWEEYQSLVKQTNLKMLEEMNQGVKVEDLEREEKLSQEDSENE